MELTFIALPVGVAFYSFRSRLPLWYGLAEVVVGMAAVGAGSRSLATVTADASSVLGILGGLYIIVRGLDNMSKGVAGTPLAVPFGVLRGE
ncbi:hypothetical protein [Rhodoblastus sp.]|uniref:hypothetical protein n=1 Tax=Rhodoblastus sp. TaxID=1962975 RepID=UPI0035B21D08